MGGVIFLSFNFIVLTACHTVNKSEKDDTSNVPSDTVEVSPDTVATVQDTAMCDSTATMNSAEVTDVDTCTTIYYDTIQQIVEYSQTDVDTCTTIYYDTILGRFRPGIVDTLIVEITSYFDGWIGFSRYKVYSTSGGVAAPFDNKDCYHGIVNEGDLDGNGTDEIRGGECGLRCWSTEHVLTYRNGKWYEMIEPFYVNTCHAEGPLVSKSDKPGYIKAKVVSYDPEDASIWGIVDSLVPIIQDGEPFR